MKLILLLLLVISCGKDRKANDPIPFINQAQEGYPRALTENEFYQHYDELKDNLFVFPRGKYLEEKRVVKMRFETRSCDFLRERSTLFVRSQGNFYIEVVRDEFKPLNTLNRFCHLRAQSLNKINDDDKGFRAHAVFIGSKELRLFNLRKFFESYFREGFSASQVTPSVFSFHKTVLVNGKREEQHSYRFDFYKTINYVKEFEQHYKDSKAIIPVLINEHYVDKPTYEIELKKILEVNPRVWLDDMSSYPSGRTSLRLKDVMHEDFDLESLFFEPENQEGQNVSTEN